jgi:hypothetical protein
MSQERRKLERKYLVIYSRVFDRDSGKVVGYLSDLTTEGAMIIGEQKIAPDVAMKLRIDLPDDPGFSDEYIDLTGKVAWCKPDIDPAFFNTGFEFINLKPTDKQTLLLMIDLYEFRHEADKYPPSITELQEGDNF